MNLPTVLPMENGMKGGQERESGIANRSHYSTYIFTIQYSFTRQASPCSTLSRWRSSVSPPPSRVRARSTLRKQNMHLSSDDQHALLHSITTKLNRQHLTKRNSRCAVRHQTPLCQPCKSRRGVA